MNCVSITQAVAEAVRTGLDKDELDEDEILAKQSFGVLTSSKCLKSPDTKFFFDSNYFEIGGPMIIAIPMLDFDSVRI